MGRWAKAGIVVAGYVAAVLAGFLAAHAYNVRVSALAEDTSGGMYAAGEAMSSAAAFLVVALVPTLLALWFLRRHKGFWNAVALVSVAFAGAGLLAVLSPLLYHPAHLHIGVELLRLSQLLGVPLWLTAFGLFAFLAPTPVSRRMLVTAIAIETVIAVCALVHWAVPASLL